MVRRLARLADGRALSEAGLRELALLASGLVLGGILAGLAGLYTPYLVLVLLPACFVAYRDTPAACVLVTLSAPLVSLGAVDVGFSLLPSYVLGLAGLAGVARRAVWRSVRPTGADSALAAFAAVAIVVSAANVGRVPATTVVGAVGANAPGVRSAAQLLAVLAMVGLYALLRCGVTERRHLDACVRALSVTVLFVGLYAVYQVVGRALDLPLTYVNDRRAASTLPTEGFIRVNSTLTEASSLAQFAAISLFLGLAWLAVGPVAAERRPRWLAPALVAGAGGLLLLTLSKAGWLACGLWAPVILWAAIRRRRISLRTAAIATVGAAAAAVGAMFARGALADPVAVLDSERYVRAGYWEAALDMVAAQPLGIGVGNFTFHYPRYASFAFDVEYESRVSDAHNLLLEAAAETGVIGGVLLAAFFVAAITGGIRAFRAGGPSASTALGLTTAFGIGLTMHMTYSYFYFPFEWVLAGLVGSLPALARTEADPTDGAGAPAEVEEERRPAASAYAEAGAGT